MPDEFRPPPLFGTVSPGDIVVEILSWLAFLQRWTVLTQLLVVLAVIVIARTRSMQLGMSRYRHRLSATGP